jgi:hypothetical protein
VRKTSFLFLLIYLLACSKERFTTSHAALLTISADTVRFDTVFTTTGSITQVFKIFNNNNQSIRISSVRLAGGVASPFKVNAGGTTGPVVENLAIGAKDSTYVFVSVTLPGTSADAPFRVQDSIEIAYNGNTQRVQLEAFGQNARFIRNSTITGIQVWTAEQPYVVLGALTVAKEAHLTITKGCRIYLHADAPLVVEGRLTVQGGPGDSSNVVFTGDRLDVPYRHYAGSWPGIRLKGESHDNSFQFAIIKNAINAIAVEASPLGEKLRLHETVIDNASGAGILATNCQMSAQNILVSNCGKNIVLQQGGTYLFTHATVASFSNVHVAHREPVLTVSNAAPDNSNTAPLSALFHNCIFWGESNSLVPAEVRVLKEGNTTFQVTFDGVQWPLAAAPEHVTVTAAPLTLDPEFVSADGETELYDFHLKETSPAVNSGLPAGVSLDLDGRPRPVGAPDLGAYENQ